MTPKYAIVRAVARTYDICVRPSGPAAPINVLLAQAQHRAYCQALQDLGLKVINIEADDRFPDCCFVEDPAIVIGSTAIITRLGVKSRMGEERAVAKTLNRYKKIRWIKPPGTIEGGDVLRINRKIYIGLSERTNLSAINQVKAIVANIDYHALRARNDSHCEERSDEAISFQHKYEVIPVRVSGMLHLKTGCAYLGNNCVTLVKGRVDAKPFSEYRKIIIPKQESYSANCLAVNGTVLMSGGYPQTRQLIKKAGFRVRELDMSEFRKGGGSLTCLSVIF